MMKKMKPYFITPELENLIERLENQAFFVGGCVRDYLMHKNVGDIDMTTPLNPEEIKERLEKSDIRIIPTGIKHGTLTLLLKSGTFVEITSFRQDQKTDGRHAEVVFGRDIQTDALRRDLTINALYMDKDGNIQDFTGALKDLKKKRIRFIGDAHKRIDEDALRILRFFRFYGLFSKASPNKEAVTACRLKRSLLKNISDERIKDEIFKILSMPTPYKTLHLMEQTGVLKTIFNKKANLQALRHLIAQEKKCGIITSPLFRCWILNGKKTPPFKLSRTEQNNLLMWKNADKEAFKSKDDFLKILFLYGKETFLNRVLFEKKGLNFQAFRFFAAIEAPVCPFTSSDVMNYFHLSGADISKKNKKAVDIWIKEGFPAKKEVVFQKLSR